MAGHQLTELDCGLRVVTERMESVRSVALGFWVGTGSASETDEQAGLSHLLEHLLFRGSEHFSSVEIDQVFDEMGAELNAGTGKEATSVHSRVAEHHAGRALEVMTDMVWRPAFEDADTERQVVLEEIAMYEDDPQDKVFDVLGQAVFGEHPLGRAVIGTAEVIRDTPLEAIRRFHGARYVAGNVVVAAAGAVEHDDVVTALAEQAEASAAPDHGSAPPPALPARVRFETKDTEQYHVCLGGWGVAQDDDRRFAARVLDALLGGTSSSRLFQEVRERRGLAYSVFTFSNQYAQAGQVGIYVGTRADRLAPALEVVGDVLRGLTGVTPPSADELARAKENVKGRLLLSLESTSARMSRLGSSLLAGVPLLEPDELVERIDAVGLEDVAALAGELFDPARLAAAGIGPREETFREALAAVSDGLAVAA